MHSNTLTLRHVVAGVIAVSMGGSTLAVSGCEIGEPEDLGQLCVDPNTVGNSNMNIQNPPSAYCQVPSKCPGHLTEQWKGVVAMGHDHGQRVVDAIAQVPKWHPGCVPVMDAGIRTKCGAPSSIIAAGTPAYNCWVNLDCSDGQIRRNGLGFGSAEQAAADSAAAQLSINYQCFADSQSAHCVSLPYCDGSDGQTQWVPETKEPPVTPDVP